MDTPLIIPGRDSGSVTVSDKYEDLPVVEIADGAFEGDTVLQEITLPATVTRIGKRAFKNCTSLKNMH